MTEDGEHDLEGEKWLPYAWLGSGLGLSFLRVRVRPRARVRARVWSGSRMPMLAARSEGGRRQRKHSLKRSEPSSRALHT